RRPCVPPNPNSDRTLKDVHWCPLSLRRRLRGDYGNLLRASDRPLPLSSNSQSPIEIRNLGGGGGEIRTHEAFRPSGFQDRRDQPLCHPSGKLVIRNQRAKYSRNTKMCSTA